jgi:hypothetical protein
MAILHRYESAMTTALDLGELKIVEKYANMPKLISEKKDLWKIAAQRLLTVNESDEVNVSVVIQNLKFLLKSDWV